MAAVLITGLFTLPTWPTATSAQTAPTAPTAPKWVETGPASDWPPPRPGAYRPPVNGQVIDPFRLDDGPYGAGNRGLEYQTAPGGPVVAVGDGTVVFAGPVAGRVSVTILHRDGRRSSVTGVGSVSVRLGDDVVQGQRIGTAGDRLHLSVREGDRYVDPAALLSAHRRRAVLIEPFAD